MSKVVIAYLMAILIIVYTFMWISTNQLVNDIERVMRGEISKSETHGTVINFYNNSDLEFTKSDCSIKTIFVLHNFKRGIVIVNYSFSIFDSNGTVIRGANNIFSLWEIERSEGQWHVICIHEKP